MSERGAQTLLNTEISATAWAVAALAMASVFSLGIFVFLVYHDIVKKLLGTSLIGFFVFGAVGASKLGELMALRHLKRELFSGNAAPPRWIRLAYRRGRDVHPMVGGIAIPPNASSVSIAFEMGGGAATRVLTRKFATVFLPALFAERPQWLALLKQE